jgi:hypothetical protein
MDDDKYIPKPCPFCKMDFNGLSFFKPNPAKNITCMRCTFCECQGPISTTQEEAIIKWNRRTK